MSCGCTVTSRISVLSITMRMRSGAMDLIVARFAYLVGPVYLMLSPADSWYDGMMFSPWSPRLITVA